MVRKIDNLEIRSVSEEICDEIWEKAEKWDYFSRKTVGDQLVRAADSIGAKISESFGRYHLWRKAKFSVLFKGQLV